MNDTHAIKVALLRYGFGSHVFDGRSFAAAALIDGVACTAIITPDHRSTGAWSVMVYRLAARPTRGEGYSDCPTMAISTAMLLAGLEVQHELH